MSACVKTPFTQAPNGIRDHKVITYRLPCRGAFDWTILSDFFMALTGAKACCAPPLRDNPEDRERVFEGLMNGALTIFSSDHAPTNYYDKDGKQV